MFGKVRVKKIGVAEWEEKVMKQGELNISLDDLAGKSSALLTLPIKIEDMQEEDNRPNRSIAFRAIIQMCKDIGVSQGLSKKQQGRLLIGILGLISSMVVGRGNASLQTQTIKLMTGSGYFNRTISTIVSDPDELPIKAVFWKIYNLMVLCNDIYKRLNGVSVTTGSPPNWLGAYSIITRASTFLADITTHKSTVPVLLDPTEPKSGMRIFVKIVVASATFYSIGTVVEVDDSTMLDMVNTWSENKGVTNSTIMIRNGLKSPETVMSGIFLLTVSLEGVLDDKNSWPYSENFIAAGAIPQEDSIFYYLFTHWWIETLHQRASSLPKVSADRAAVMLLNFETHGFNWMLLTLVPAILRSLHESPFATHPNEWNDIADALKSKGINFAMAIISASTLDEKAEEANYAKIRILLVAFGSSAEYTTSDIHLYGLYRKAQRLQKSGKDQMKGYEKPEELINSDSFKGAKAVSMTITSHLAPTGLSHRIAFGLLRTMPSASIRLAGDDICPPTIQITDNEYLECDDTCQSREDMIDQLKRGIWGLGEEIEQFVNKSYIKNLKKSNLDEYGNTIEIPVPPSPAPPLPVTRPPKTSSSGSPSAPPSPKKARNVTALERKIAFISRIDQYNASEFKRPRTEMKDLDIVYDTCVFNLNITIDGNMEETVMSYILATGPEKKVLIEALSPDVVALCRYWMGIIKTKDMIPPKGDTPDDDDETMSTSEEGSG